MKALRYKIKVSEGTIAMVHGMYSVIDEILVEDLGAIINYSGVNFPKFLPSRLSEATNVSEIDIPDTVISRIETIKQAKDFELDVVKEFGMEQKQ